MIVRVKAVGSGTVADPYRVPFPTYRIVADDGNIPPIAYYVDIPDLLIPPGILIAPGLTSQISINGKVTTVLTTVPPGLMMQWYQELDISYQEHAGQFRHIVQ